MPDREVVNSLISIVVRLWVVCSVVLGVALSGSFTGAARGQAAIDQDDERLGWWVEDLANDDIRWNANAALGHLFGAGDVARAALDRAVSSEDWQQRHLAALVLWPLVDDKPSRRLIAVTLEGMSSLSVPPETDHTCLPLLPNYRMRRGVSYLMDHTEVAEPQLAEALDSEDFQLRFLAAFLLGINGHDQHLTSILPILLPHLNDNRISGDAQMAAAALYRLGPGVISHLESSKAQADEQGRALIEVILIDLKEDASGQINHDYVRYGWARRHGITQMYHDPVREYELGYFGAIREE